MKSKIEHLRNSLRTIGEEVRYKVLSVFEEARHSLRELDAMEYILHGRRMEEIERQHQANKAAIKMDEALHKIVEVRPEEKNEGKHDATTTPDIHNKTLVFPETSDAKTDESAGINLANPMSSSAAASATTEEIEEEAKIDELIENLPPMPSNRFYIFSQAYTDKLPDKIIKHSIAFDIFCTQARVMPGNFDPVPGNTKYIKRAIKK